MPAPGPGLHWAGFLGSGPRSRGMSDHSVDTHRQTGDTCLFGALLTPPPASSHPRGPLGCRTDSTCAPGLLSAHHPAPSQGRLCARAVSRDPHASRAPCHTLGRPLARLKIKTQISPTVWRLVTNALEEEEVGVCARAHPSIAACPQGRACSTRGQRCLQELPTSETQRPCPGPGFKGVQGVKVRVSLWFTSQPPPRRPALPQAAQPVPASCQAAGQDQSPSCCRQQPPRCARRHHSQTAVAGGAAGAAGRRAPAGQAWGSL